MSTMNFRGSGTSNPTHAEKIGGARSMIPLATIILLVALFLTELAWLWRQ